MALSDWKFYEHPPLPAPRPKSDWKFYEHPPPRPKSDWKFYEHPPLPAPRPKRPRPAPRPGLGRTGSTAGAYTRGFQAAVAQQSVYDWVAGVFEGYGMGALGKDVLKILRKAKSPEHAMVEIRKTDSYKTRFAGNVARLKSGFGMLSEGEYLGLEQSYRSALRQAGMPKGFYDAPGDFAKWIGGDVSPAEIARRAEMAGKLAANQDPGLRSALKQRGIKQGHIAAYLLNPNKALPIIEREVASAELSAEAFRAGFKGLGGSVGYMDRLVGKGITQGAAREAFQATAEELPTVQFLGSLEGEDFSVKQVAEAELDIAPKVRKRLASQARRERARFGGTSGGATQFLSEAQSGAF